MILGLMAIILFPIIIFFFISLLCLVFIIFIVLFIVAILVMLFLAPYYYLKMKPEVQTHASYRLDEIGDPEERSRKPK